MLSKAALRSEALTIDTIKNTHMAVHGAPLVHMVEHYLQTFDWQAAIQAVLPKVTLCGLIYQLENPFGDAQLSFAVADMRNITCCKPHYHINGETEIYVVMQDSGLVVGEQERHVVKGDVIITPPVVAHFTLPEDELVFAIVNTPPFDVANMVEVHESCTVVGFDKDQFDRLINEAMQKKEEKTR